MVKNNDRKNECIEQLKSMVTEETVIYTVLIKRTKSLNYLVSSFIAKDNKIVRISHLIAGAFELKLTKEQEYYTGVIGTDPFFNAANDIGKLFFNKALPYQAL